MKRLKTLKFNLYSIFIVSICIPFFISFVFFTIYYNVIINRQEQNNTDNILNSVSMNIETMLSELNDIAITGYMHTNILNAMESFNAPFLYSYYDDLKLSQLENDYTNAMFKQMFTSRQSIQNISFFPISKQSENFYSLSKTGIGLKQIPYPSYHTQNWFLSAVSKKGDTLYYPAHTTDYLKDEDTAFVYSSLKLIINYDSKKYIGVLKIDSDITDLQNLLNSITPNNESLLMLTDADGNLIVSTGTPPKIPAGPLQSGTHKYENHSYKVTTQNIKNTDWNLVSLSSMEDTVQRTAFSFVISFSCMILGIFTAFLVYQGRSRYLLVSVKNITDTLKTIENGDLSARSSVSASNEFRTISDAVNRMSIHLDEHIKKEYIAVIKQQKAEYQALQSQINPHFLYNTLNGFIALNRMGERKQLEQGILQLTHMLRYTCSSRENTTIKEEVEFLHKYLLLQKLKYDERLEFSILSEEDVDSYQIPKLLLQPVVENCVLHGLEPTDETIHINIFVHSLNTPCFGKLLIIFIADTGVGYNPAAISTASEHIGVKNVQDRVSLFQKDSIFSVRSAPGKGTQTTIIFSLENKKPMEDPI